MAQKTTDNLLSESEKEELITKLRNTEDIDIATHSGTYELVQKAVELYAQEAEEKDKWDVNDLNMILQFGSLKHGQSKRNEKIKSCHLNENSKSILKSLNNRISMNKYTNHQDKDNGNCGLFTMDRGSLIKNCKSENARQFITMLITIYNEKSKKKVYLNVKKYLSQKIDGIKAGIASQILHTLKPDLFPILNEKGRKGYKLIVKLSAPDDDATKYMDNVDKINSFIEEHSINKNFRTIDLFFVSYKDAEEKNVNDGASPNNDNKPSQEEDFLSDVFSIDKKEYATISNLLKRKKNLILKGAPGVGKTFAAKRIAYKFMNEKNDDRICFVQFHQNTSYEDFVEGYRPNENGVFKLRDGVFKDFCDKASKDKENSYFLIIDEINRGNLSKILGELLVLIEAEKREKEHITLAYNGKGESFTVPDNLYIIGMMNTADRSLEMIDYALRRRFVFYTMKPAFDSDKFITYANKESPLYRKVINTVKDVNLKIKEDKSLGEGFMIGHSYFCGNDEGTSDNEWLSNVIEYEIIPLIEEYWFDNENKVEEVCKDLRDCLNFETHSDGAESDGTK